MWENIRSFHYFFVLCWFIKWTLLLFQFPTKPSSPCPPQSRWRSWRSIRHTGYKRSMTDPLHKPHTGQPLLHNWTQDHSCIADHKVPSKSCLIMVLKGCVSLIQTFLNSARSDGCARSPSAHACRVCLSPHQHERKFFGACVCRVTFKHLLQPLRSHIRSFGTLGQLFKIPPLSAQICHSAGGRGGPRFIFLIGILIFLWLNSPCKKFETLAAFFLVEK